MFFPLFLFCSKNSDVKQNNSLSFDVDTELLGNELVLEELGLTVSPPKNCKPLQPQVYKEFLSRLSEKMNPVDSLLIEPKALFFDQQNNILFSVSKINFTDSISTVGDYEKELMKKFSTLDAKKVIFEYKNFTIHQLRVISNDSILFKLIVLQKENFIQLDYIIPKQGYHNYLKAIESSIGSLKSNGG